MTSSSVDAHLEVPARGTASAGSGATPEQRRAPFDERTGAWAEEVPSEAAELTDWQLRRAWAVAERVAADNPFYQGRFRLPAKPSSEAFRSLPVTTKDAIVADCEAYPPYGSRTACKVDAISHVVETSGTSGQGREVYALDALDEQAIFRTEAVGFWWAGVRRGTPVLLTLPIGVTAAGIWYYHGLRLLGANVLCAGAYATERKVELLTRYGADLVVGTPSYVQRLGLACRAAGVDPARLGVSALMVAGEPYGPRWAQEIERLWGARLYEQYGCSERAIAWTCPGGVVRNGELGTLHFPSEGAYIEVVDPRSGDHVGHGETGELIVTPLQAAASPLVRFATRDRVQWRAPGSCRCGRPLAGIAAGDVQRYDDMIKVRGLNIWPRAVDALVLDVEGVRDYRAVVHRDPAGREIVELEVEPLAELAAEVGTRVAAAVRRAFDLKVQARTVPAGAITGSIPEGFVKISRWHDMRGESPVGSEES